MKYLVLFLLTACAILLILTGCSSSDILVKDCRVVLGDVQKCKRL